jgi:NAD(P)-dependent dehydrogenase (short-subunit alcohol dehydrogenase family)
MRIIVVGATGTIGRAIVAALGTKHEIIPVGNHQGTQRVDLGDSASIERMYAAVGTVDAVISAAGLGKFGPVASLTDADFAFSIGNKLMGQVNLIRRGIAFVADGGSFTLTSGILAQQPIPGSAAISVVNAGVEAFARAAALELPRGLRANVISPPWVSETLTSMGRDPAGGLTAAVVAKAYVRSLEGSMTGQVLSP